MTTAGIVDQGGNRLAAPRIWQYGYPYGVPGGWPETGPPWPPFQDFSPAEPGVAWNWPRLYTEVQWDMFYRLGYSPDLLYNDGTIEGGIEAVKDVLIRENFFRVYVQWYHDALHAEPPVLRGDNETLSSWLEEIGEEVIETMAEATRYNLIKDRMTVVVDGDGQHMAVDPSYTWPIADPRNYRKYIAVLLAYVWRRAQTAWDYRGALPPNRITFVRWDPDGRIPGGPGPGGDVRHYSLAGTQVGGEGPVQQTVGELELDQRADVRAVITEGHGESLFSDLGDIVRGLIVRESGDNVVLNSNISPILWVPSGTLDPAQQRVQIQKAGGTRILQALSMEERPPQYVVYDGGLQDSAEVYQRLLSSFQWLTGISKVAQGMDVGKGESGSSREAMLFTAHSRILTLRSRWEKVCRQLLDALPERPEGRVFIEWVEDPFVSKTGRRAQALQEFKAGLVDGVTTLMRMGLSESEAEGIAERVYGEMERKAQLELQANQANPENMGGNPGAGPPGQGAQ